MVSRILAFRPASVVERLAPRSDACPLSLRDLLGPASALGIVLPVVRAPIAGVARAALVAAKEHRSALGLALPPGALPEPWFEAVTRAADELAAGLPIFLSAEVKVDGDGATQVERAVHEAWRLVDAGVTHLAIDVVAVERLDRGRVVADVAAGAVERGICVDCVLPLEDAGHARAAELVDELARRGAAPDVASVRCPAPAGADEARLQVAALARVCAAISGVPVMRRGPVTPELLRLLAGSPVKACDDGGQAAARAVSVIPWDLLAPEEGAVPARESRLEKAARELSEEGGDRLEARAYLEAMQFLEALGAPGSALRVSRELERQLEDR